VAALVWKVSPSISHCCVSHCSVTSGGGSAAAAVEASTEIASTGRQAAPAAPHRGAFPENTQCSVRD